MWLNKEIKLVDKKKNELYYKLLKGEISSEEYAKKTNRLFLKRRNK